MAKRGICRASRSARTAAQPRRDGRLISWEDSVGRLSDADRDRVNDLMVKNMGLVGFVLKEFFPHLRGHTRDEAWSCLVEVLMRCAYRGADESVGTFSTYFVGSAVPALVGWLSNVRYDRFRNGKKPKQHLFVYDTEKVWKPIRGWVFSELTDRRYADYTHPKYARSDPSADEGIETHPVIPFLQNIIYSSRWRKPFYVISNIRKVYAMWLRHHDGRTCDEVSQIMGVDQSTVSVLDARGCRWLRDRFLRLGTTESGADPKM